MRTRLRSTPTSSSLSSSDPITTPESLVQLRAGAARSGILLDLDGTLSEIVPRPEMAQPAPGALKAISALVGRYAVVAIVSGRSADEVQERVDIPGVRIEGSYGLKDEPLEDPVLKGAAEAAGSLPGAWAEAKGASVAVHYRQASDPIAARALLSSSLGSLAQRHRLALIEGKMVFELVRPDVPLKGGVVQEICEEHRLEGALYAGDDVADLEAFQALERSNLDPAIRVAVSGPETPDALLEAADLVVDGPAGLVELLRAL